MSISAETAWVAEACPDDAAETGELVEVTADAVAPPTKSRTRRLAERGLTTVEYAIGLLAAATVALVLLRIFSDNAFFQMLFDYVVDLFAGMADRLK